MSNLKNALTESLKGDAKRDNAQRPVATPLYEVPRARFLDAARSMKSMDARLAAQWATDETPSGRGFGIYACFALDSEYLIIKTFAPALDPTFQSLTKKFVPAYRFERQMKSLMGVIPEGHPDQRPWIKHEDWPEDAWPLRKNFDPSMPLGRVKGEYPWIKAEGEGVYEIPVGPVHAGIIEPGHFRFQAVGEDVLNLEERLGYVHKGIEKRFESFSWQEAIRLAGRVSGDSTVAHALAYAMAVEAMTGMSPPERALYLRAVMLERERIANHIGDIGAICNDAAFAFLMHQFSRLKENMLRANYKLFGHRFMMDKISIGGIDADIDMDGAQAIVRELDVLCREFERLVIIYDENPSLEDRVRDTGVLKPAVAKELGVVGFTARASGQAIDVRLKNPFPPYDRVAPKLVSLDSGDVHARVWVRIEEVRDSIRIIKELVSTMPSGHLKADFVPPAPHMSGFGVVEGWRGEIIYWVQSGKDGEINRSMTRDPSSVNWLGLEQAIQGNIVPDFPLCNKSFNQSYSGNDL